MRYGLAEGQWTENEIFVLVVFCNLIKAISLHVPQFTHLCDGWLDGTSKNL